MHDRVHPGEGVERRRHARRAEAVRVPAVPWLRHVSELFDEPLMAQSHVLQLLRERRDRVIVLREAAVHDLDGSRGDQLFEHCLRHKVLVVRRPLEPSLEEGRL